MIKKNLSDSVRMKAFSDFLNGRQELVKMLIIFQPIVLGISLFTQE